MNELTTTQGTELSSEERALALHKEILYNYRMAASHLVDAAKGLKQMRDTKAYKELGLETFEDYTEKMAGIKARQAYTYISAYERLGQPMMEEHAGLGITKLSLLAEITPAEREEFASENDLAGMTVKEIEELVAENTRRGEQISMFEEKEADMASAAEEKERQIEELREKIRELENKPPAQVTVVQADEETMADIRQQAEEEARAAAEEGRQAAIDKAVEDAMAAVKEKQDKDKQKLKKATEEAKAAKKEVEELKAQQERERVAAEERAAVLAEQMEQLRNEKRSAEAQAASAGNSAVQIFAIRFENLQREYDALTALLEEIRQEDAVMADKLSGAMQRLLKQMQTSFGAGVSGDA